MEVFMTVALFIVCSVGLYIAVYTAVDIDRFVKNGRMYERTRKDCHKREGVFSTMQLMESGLDKSMDYLSNKEYLEKINEFRKSVVLPLLEKSDLK